MKPTRPSWQARDDDERCERCGRRLTQDPPDDPDGRMCGDCERERELEADLMDLDARDGTIDGEFES